ncbi:MAG: NERD domain-containing protein [Oscillospiraceae bacterium]|nr:NERD domain-containing protein [Oscillospiraceae bacterium]
MPWKTIETDKGRKGEYEVYARLAQLDGPRDFFFNVYVPRDDGTTTEADIVMVHPKGLFVYEVKNYEGWIFGRFEQANWTQCLPGQFEAQKFKFFNPIKQNNVHVKALSEYLGLPRERIIPITAFSDACEFKDLSGTDGGKVPNLCKFSTVFAATELAIMQSKYEMTEDEYSSLCHEIENLCNADEATKAAHILHVREQQEKARARFAGNKNKPAAEDGEEDTREEAELPETVQADTSEASNDEGRTPGEEPPSDATVRVLCPSCGSEIKPWEGGVCRLCGTCVG